MRCRQSSRLLQKHGFSLIEMLVVLAIVAISAGIALPYLAKPSQILQAKQFALQISAYARAAQSEAMRSGAPTRLSLDIAGRRLTLDGKRPPVDYPASLNVSMTAANVRAAVADQGDVIFFADGSATGATITVEGDSSYQVTIDWLTGASTLEIIRP